MTTSDPIHISVVLDRSGSMARIADFVVDGFNEYLNEQRQRDGTARLSLVQFDSSDPFEVLIDGRDLKRVYDLDHAAYQPRGMTPLMDAVGGMIGRIDSDVANRKSANLEEEDQIVVVVTDGQENASREFTRATIFELVEKRRQDGWVFVFLGADQDSYAEGQAMGVAGANTANWVKSKKGVDKVWRDLGHATSVHRMKQKAARMADRDRFYAEKQSAE